MLGKMGKISPVCKGLKQTNNNVQVGNPAPSTALPVWECSVRCNGGMLGWSAR